MCLIRKVIGLTMVTLMVAAGVVTAQTATPAAPAATPSPLTTLPTLVLGPGPTFTLKGYLNTGLAVLANGQDKADIGLWADEANDLKDGGRFKLLGIWDYQGNGLAFDLRSDNLLSGAYDQLTGTAPSGTTNLKSTAPIYLKSVYVYGNYLNNLIYVQMGVIRDTNNRPQGDMAPTFTKETPGAEIEVKPLSGLSLNAAIVDFEVASNSSVMANGVGNLYDTPTAFGGIYSVPGVGLVEGEAEFATTTNSGNPYAFARAYAGASVTAVPHLTFWLEGLLEGNQNNISSGGNITSTGITGATSGITVPASTSWVNSGKSLFLNAGVPNGILSVAETISYSLNDFGLAPLTLGLISYQFFYDQGITEADCASLTPGFRISPSVAYAFDNGITPKLSATYFRGSECLNGSLSQNLSYQNDLDNVMGQSAAIPTTGNYNNAAIFSVSPSVKFTLSPSQYINLIYTYVMSAGSDNVTFLDQNSNATSLSVIQANFFYQF